MPRKPKHIPFSEVAGETIPCARDGFPHYSVFGAALFSIFPSMNHDGKELKPIVLKLRGGRRFEVVVVGAELVSPAFKEHYRFKCQAHLADDEGKLKRVQWVEVEQFTGDSGRRVCYVKFPKTA